MVWVIWITGLPGSGKSSLTCSIKKLYPEAVVLNMDEFRKVVTPAPSYSEMEREIVYRGIVYLAMRLYKLGHKVIIDATGHQRAWRNLARKLIKNFYEIYLKCPVDVCMKRESKRIDTHNAPLDIYKKGNAGAPVPGLTVRYEEGMNPELIIDTVNVSSERASNEIFNFLEKKASIKSKE